MQYLHGAAPETIAEILELATGLREHYKRKGMLEEILVQKIVVEPARLCPRTESSYQISSCSLR